MTIQLTIALIVSPRKAIMYTFNAPGFPSAVTDDADNTYTRHREGGMIANWYTVTDKDRLPCNFTLAYPDGDAHFEAE